MKLQEEADKAFKAADVMKQQSKQLNDALKAQTFKAGPAAKPEQAKQESAQQAPAQDKQNQQAQSQ